ncbi:tRNA glutamyl-Q(34) synthetase GluQRS [Parvularcula bermudensis]|uniref:tRNA glutamyl-Q(34) synthetase GluQRS n=1 Tax=Parvularcula bermudensis TaxID=208216 RepID=UPI0003184670|nr:tRNA glutamyl-Q(34) synthetase GluQRS [Parvularcula bermudensis]
MPEPGDAPRVSPAQLEASTSQPKGEKTVTKMRTRFAPSPTGYLHLGHAFSALLAHRTALSLGGTCLLRIEDIDHTRCRPVFESAIFEDLAWLGMTWPQPVVRQSSRLAHYDEALAGLLDRGLVYRCFRSRADLAEAASAPHGPIGPVLRAGPLPPRQERALLDAKEPFAWRLWSDEVRAYLGAELSHLSATAWTPAGMHHIPVDLAAVGDVVLGRKDLGTSYHLASVIDDIDQTVSHVIRGEDLAPIAGLHRLLYRLFEAAAPVYYHHPLILGPQGKRLAKRDQAETLRAYRERGVTPDRLKARLGLDTTVLPFSNGLSQTRPQDR